MRTSPSRLSALYALAGLLVVVLIGFAVYALVAPSSYYLLLPDEPHELAPLVEVQGGKESGDGDVYFVDVVTRRATLAERYLAFLRADAELVSKRDFIPDNIDEDLRRRLDEEAMERSKELAGAVALRSLGYEVEIAGGNRVQRTEKGSPASRVLRSGDLIVAVDGEPARTSRRLQELIGAHRPGERLTLTIVRGGQRMRVTLKTYVHGAQSGRPVIGVIVEPFVKVELPLEVEIDDRGVVGPSAGLAFALQITDELGRDVDRGRHVAATGELTLEGGVLPVGAIKQKVVGARRAGIEIMLVPAGDNAREARRYAGEMEIIAVRSYQQALRALTTRP